MLFHNIDILDENLDHHSGYHVGIRGERIAYIGATPPLEDFGETYDGTGKLLMTALFNAHSHSAMTLMRGFAENLALSDWLNQKIFPLEAKLNEDAIYNGTMLAAAEMLRFGIVSTTDMYFNARANSRAVRDSGIKMNLGIPVTCFDDRGIRELPVYHEICDSLAQLHNTEDGRLKIDLSIHAEYTSTQRVVEDAVQIARDANSSFHIHLSETMAEVIACKQRHQGRTPVRYFYDAGVFDLPTTAAHCIWLEEEDFDLLREKHVTIACCPVSNLKLASGFCNAPKLLGMGLNVALGTDGAASNNNLNLWEEVKWFSTVYKGSTGDPTAITPKQALYAATRAGALAQGRTDCGALEVGNRADVIVLDLRNRPYMYPCHSMLNNIVFSALGSDVCLTMVDGNILYQDGIYTGIDIESVIDNAKSSVQKLLKNG